MISIKDLEFCYGKKPVLCNFTLQLHKGNIYGLLGRNGAGKTTLLKLISGELFPQSGKLDILNCTPSKRIPSFLADIFYIPEEFSLPPMAAKEYIRLMSPFYPKFNSSRFDKYLGEFELPKTDEKITKMSYGQKKKFLLAFGLAAETSLLLLDEPTNGLDIPSKTQFRRTVASALGDDQIFLISTHQVRDMENLIDPLIIIDEGKLFLNTSLERVAEKYVMKHIPKGEVPEEALYCEPIPGGQMIVKKRKEEESESAIDLEVLFNFAINQGGLN